MKYLVFLIAMVAHATTPVISNYTVDNVTPYGARASWTSDITSTTYIKWGTSSGMLTNTATELASLGGTTHAWFLSGLAPSTTYYTRGCGLNGPDEGCSAETSFTTSAAETGISTLPTLPTAVAQLTAPTSFTGTKSVAADCNDLQTQMTAAAAEDGNDNWRILIPAGTICGGRFEMKARSGANPNGNGFQVLTSDTTIVPAGAQVGTTTHTNYARIISNWWDIDSIANSAPAGSAGGVWVDGDSVDYNAFLHFHNGTTWVAQSMTSGTASPLGTSCVAQIFYAETDRALADRLWYCFETDKWINLHFEVNHNSTPSAALSFEANAKRIAIVGVSIERWPLPTAYTSLLPTASGTGTQTASIQWCLTYTSATNDRILFERNWFEGVGYPNRMNDAICGAEGTNLVIRDNYFNEMNRWMPTSASEWTPNTIFMRSTGGPALITNNYFKNCHGITIFHSDDDQDGVMSDVTVTKNTFYENIVDDLQALTTVGRYYFRRHQLELKRGIRWLIEGNVFNGGWPSINQGATIAFTPRPGSAGCTRTNNVQVADITFRYNQILYSPQPFILTGRNDYGNCQPKETNRVWIYSNQIAVTGKASDNSTNGADPNAKQFGGQIMNIGLGFQNVTFERNAFLGVSTAGGAYANMVSFAGDWEDSPNSRGVWISNLYTALAAVNQGWWGVQVGGGVLGTPALDANMLAGASTSYTFSGNAMQMMFNGVFPDVEPYPSGNYRNSTVANFTGALYQCTTCGDIVTARPLYNSIFAPASSTARGYYRTASGPDYVAYDAAQGNVTDLRVISIAATTATVAYTAPDSDACTVEHGTSSTPLTGTRTADAGGSRFRTVNLSSLTTSTTYYVRLYCKRLTSTSFRTL